MSFSIFFSKSSSISAAAAKNQSSPPESESKTFGKTIAKIISGNTKITILKIKVHKKYFRIFSTEE